MSKFVDRFVRSISHDRAPQKKERSQPQPSFTGDRPEHQHPPQAVPGSVPHASHAPLRKKLMQLVRPRTMSHKPALRFDQEWAVAAPEIGRAWVACRQAHAPEAINLIALSRMKALDHERRHLSEIAPGERTFPELDTREAFYQAQILAFLDAVGEQDRDAVLEHFRHVGTGGLHRHPAIAMATVGNALGAAQQITPDLFAKAILSAVRLALQLGYFHQIVEAGPRRMRNAQTENVMTTGRADASPSAKKAPDLLAASAEVMGNLKKAQKTLARVEAAMAAHQAAREHCRRAGVGDPAALRALEAATDRLELAFAKACHLMQVKAEYKAASETGKAEFFGNKRYFAASFSSSALTLGASLISILAPVVLSSVVTGGISAAAVLLAAGIYLTYHFSDGASHDGEEKMKRAIIAVSKSLDVLHEDSGAAYRARAEAYKAYRQEVRSLWKSPSTLFDRQARALRKAERKAALLARLRTISRQDAEPPGLSARRNWQLYREYQRGCTAPGTDPEQRRALDEQLKAKLEGQFATGAISDLWKKDIRIRMDAARQLLAGKTANTIERLLATNSKTAATRIWKSAGKDRQARLAGLKTELVDTLADALNLELALQRMEAACTTAPGSDAAQQAVAHGSSALAAVRDSDVRGIFCGGAEQQTDLLKKAAAEVVGQRERYFWPNFGNALVGMTVSGAVTTADSAINIAKAEGEYHGPKFADYKFLQSQQPLPQGAAYQNAGSRTPFKERETKKLLAAIGGKMPGRVVQFALGLENDGRPCFAIEDGKVAAALENAVDRLLADGEFPGTITLQQDAGSSAGHGNAGEATDRNRNLDIKLSETRSYWDHQYKQAPAAERSAYRKRVMKTLGRQVKVSLAGPTVQGLAQRPLKTSRPAMRRLEELRPAVRQALRDDAREHAALPTASALGTGIAVATGARSDFLEAVLRAADSVQIPPSVGALSDAELLCAWGLDGLLPRDGTP